MSTFISEPGTRLGGRYRLEDRLAAASGWSAWKAIDEILARPVSVITFASGFPRLPQVVTAARAASRLTDTRLTQVFDVEDSWDRAYIVLEWPVGETLADMLATGTLDPTGGARIVAETASALSGAHAAGLAHLCLQPEAVRWTSGGGLKITGLGIDAALAGITADDPELTDTRSLGGLLYAALTGFWPGADRPDLPPAPMSDGRPRRPRQVRAGVPSSLDEIASRALDLGGRDGRPYASPGELASALAAAIPPVPIPPAAQARRDPRRDVPRDQRRDTSGQWRDERRETADWHQERDQGGQGAPGGGRRNPARIVAVAVVALVVVAGLSAGALRLLHSPATRSHGGRPSSSPSSASASATLLAPVAAQGFDALRTPAEDPSDENSSLAVNLINHSPEGWETHEYYGSSHFGNLKSGSGLILDMGRPVTITSVTITFGTAPGADVQLKIGNSNARSAANEQSMATVASMNNAVGQQMFTITKPVTGRYLVVWFTNLPQVPHVPGKYRAEIFTIMIRGTA
jgi:serine/threonine protein kinase